MATHKDGKTFSYKMGTNNAKLLLKGAQESAERHSCLFIGEKRTALYAQRPDLEGDGKFMFGRAKA